MDESLDGLLYDWNETYKKSLLSFWILLSLSEGAKYPAEITYFLLEHSEGVMHVKEQSLYRALRRFKAMGIIEVEERPSPHGGPNRKYFSLSTNGMILLKEFTKQNIQPLYTNDVKNRINSILNGDAPQ